MKCENCEIEMVTRMFDVEGTHDIVEKYTCLECGYTSHVPVECEHGRVSDENCSACMLVKR